MFIAILGSIPLDPSLTQSLEDGQAFIDLFPNSPTLNAVNNITTKLLQLDIDWDQWCREDFLANLDRNTVFGLAQQDYQQIQIFLLPTVYTDRPSGKNNSEGINKVTLSLLTPNSHCSLTLQEKWPTE